MRFIYCEFLKANSLCSEQFEHVCSLPQIIEPVIRKKKKKH